jgi:60 kDa SS-A/Ro ribonucleoprotein
MEKMPFGSTDCSLPIQYAREMKSNFDAFMTFTDNETGGANPSKVLRTYREESGIDAKFIVNAMVVNKFTIADPLDPGMLDVCGFSSDVPAVVGDFITN